MPSLTEIKGRVQLWKGDFHDAAVCIACIRFAETNVPAKPLIRRSIDTEGGLEAGPEIADFLK
jgi:hypothetical protein